MPNPLAIDVTIGGLLLGAVQPRPKPRASTPWEPSLLSARRDPRTPWPGDARPEYDGTALAG